MLIYCSTWITNEIQRYRQSIDVTSDTTRLRNLHELFHTIASTLADFYGYCQDVEQFRYFHRFDLQHRLSVMSLGENQQKLQSLVKNESITSNQQFASNLNSAVGAPRSIPSLFDSSTASLSQTSSIESKIHMTNADDASSSTSSYETSASDSSSTNITSNSTIKLQLRWFVS